MTRPIRGWTRIVLAGALAIGIAACSQDVSTPLEPADSGSLGMSSLKTTEAILVDMLERTNTGLASQGAAYRVAKIEAISGDPSEMGITVLWKDVGNKRIGADLVPGDPRRDAASGGWSADPNAISFSIDPVDGTTLNGVPGAVTSAEIRDAMATWNGVQCSDLGLTEVVSPVDLGVVAFIFGFGGSPFVVADIHHAGWLELEFGGATIAATFTFVWIDEDENPTDIDNNRLDDTAFSEVYYDAICQGCTPPNFWRWEVANGINEAGIDIDIESIALHESGHGLSQDHFGKGFLTPSNNVLHLTSNSVLAASYTGPKISLRGPDIGGHCASWANWPNR